MMITFPEDNSFKTVILLCASSFCYGLAVFFALIFTDHKYSLGKFSSLPLVGIFFLFECAKYFVSLYIHPIAEEPYNRRDDRAITTFKKCLYKFKIKEVFKCSLYFGITVLVYFVTFIVFGAEVFSRHEETLMLSLLLTVFTLVHACINLGSQSVMNILLGAKPCSSTGKMIYRNIQGTILGTWLGAFFIPLDWDRPWQDWPITCALGCILGFTVSNFLSASVVLINHSKKVKYGRKAL